MSATQSLRRLEAAGFTREDLANLRAEIFKFLVTGLAIQAGVIVALVKLL